MGKGKCPKRHDVKESDGIGLPASRTEMFVPETGKPMPSDSLTSCRFGHLPLAKSLHGRPFFVHWHKGFSPASFTTSTAPGCCAPSTRAVPARPTCSQSQLLPFKHFPRAQNIHGRLFLGGQGWFGSPGICGPPDSICCPSFRLCAAGGTVAPIGGLSVLWPSPFAAASTRASMRLTTTCCHCPCMPICGSFPAQSASSLLIKFSILRAWSAVGMSEVAYIKLLYRCWNPSC